MTKVLYTAHAEVTGGHVNGHGRSRRPAGGGPPRSAEEMGGGNITVDLRLSGEPI